MYRWEPKSALEYDPCPVMQRYLFPSSYSSCTATCRSSISFASHCTFLPEAELVHRDSLPSRTPFLLSFHSRVVHRLFLVHTNGLSDLADYDCPDALLFSWSARTDSAHPKDPNRQIACKPFSDRRILWVSASGTII